MESYTLNKQHLIFVGILEADLLGVVVDHVAVLPEGGVEPTPGRQVCLVAEPKVPLAN